MSREVSIKRNMGEAFGTYLLGDDEAVTPCITHSNVVGVDGPALGPRLPCPTCPNAMLLSMQWVTKSVFGLAVRSRPPVSTVLLVRRTAKPKTLFVMRRSRRVSPGSWGQPRQIAGRRGRTEDENAIHIGFGQGSHHPWAHTEINEERP